MIEHDDACRRRILRDAAVTFHSLFKLILQMTKNVQFEPRIKRHHGVDMAYVTLKYTAFF